MAGQTITLLDRHANLPIDTEVRLLVAGPDAKFYRGFIGNDQRPMGQRMGAHWRHHEGGYRRHEHWAACGERVGGRSSGGGDNDAVSLAIEDENAIDNQIEIQEAGDSALAHHSIIQRKVLRRFLAVAKQAAME